MLRDPRARWTLIVPPTLQLFIFSFAATMEVKNIDLAIVDLDRGPYAADIEQRLRGSPSFTALPFYPSVAAARADFERERVIGVLVLQSGFSTDSRGRAARDRAAAARWTSLECGADRGAVREPHRLGGRYEPHRRGGYRHGER